MHHSSTSRLASLLAVTVAAAGAHAQLQQQTSRVHTAPSGAFVNSDWRSGPAAPRGPATRAQLWSYHNSFFGIPESVALSPFTNSAWAGEMLNGERLERFDLPGDGTPMFNFLAGRGSPAAVAVAKDADFVAFIDGSGLSGPFTLRAFHTASNTPLWSHPFDASFNNNAVQHSLKVSRDGSLVFCALNAYDQNTMINTGRLFIFDAAGNVLRSWDAPNNGFISAIDITDDASLCLVTNNSTAELIDTTTLADVFTASASGAGGRFAISGNGDTIVVGGFDFNVYHRVAGTYNHIITFSAPTSWFGWGSAVSRDGLTVAVMSHNYGDNYLSTDTRIWDVPSAQLLGTFSTTGTGMFQDAIAGAGASDNGNVVAVCSWGTQDNAHPEVMIFDRTVHMIGSMDTAGSPFDIAVSGDGRYVIAGSKAVHANTFGNGGYVTLFQTAVVCRADIDGNGQVNLQDFLAFLQLFATADPRADFDGNGAVNLQDFLGFLQAFATGCP
jgi:hypothetical protein